MSKETLEYHHDLHHKAYVDNGNKLIAGTEWEAKSLEDIVRGTYGRRRGAERHLQQRQPALEPQPVLGSDGPGRRPRRCRARWKRRWSRLSARSPSSRKISPPPARASSARAGPGWCKDKDGALKVTKTENGVNPLCFGQTALLGCDVWEHSYYIDFRNKRPAYLTNFLEKLVNWEAVAARM
jgi:Fe-Mn family superoxide dismutase